MIYVPDPKDPAYVALPPRLGCVCAEDVPPLDFPFLFGMWRADLATEEDNVSDGGGIGTPPNYWVDVSGNNNHLINTPGGTDPTLDLTNTINNLPTIKFDGVPLAENLKFTNPIVLPGDFSIFLVLREAATNSSTLIANSAINEHIGKHIGGPNLVNFFDGATNVNSTAYAAGVGTPHLITVRRNAGTVSFWENKTSRGTGVAADGVTFNNIALVTYSPTLFDGAYAELIIYGTHMTDANVIFLYDNWFALPSRWALP